LIKIHKNNLVSKYVTHQWLDSRWISEFTQTSHMIHTMCARRAQISEGLRSWSCMAYWS